MQGSWAYGIALWVVLIWLTAVSFCIATDQFCNDASFWTCHDNTECIHRDWKCDGYEDCDDGSDEWASTCVTSTRRKRRSTTNTPYGLSAKFLPCKPNYERCPGEEKCIHLAKFCDKNNDCKLNKDESSCNGTFSTSCDKLNCEYKCTITKYGPTCYCAEGKISNGTSCVPVNECDYTGYCDQYCTDNENSYKCSCAKGYQLDSKSCYAINNPKRLDPVLLVADYHNMFQLRLDNGKIVASTSEHEDYIKTVDFNHVKGIICWVAYESSQRESKMNCLRKNSTGFVKERLYTEVTLETIESIAQDWITGNWYFVDSVNYRIILCNSSGINCATILNTGENVPQTIVLEPNMGLLFYTAMSEKHGSTITQANMDGSNKKTVVSKMVSPYGMTIDYPNKHLYWVDSALDTIERINIDGKPIVRYIITRLDVRNTKGISIHENWLYVTSDDKTTLSKVHRWDRTKPVKTFNVNLKNPHQIKVYHRLRQPVEVDNNCTQLKCQHLCVNVPNENSTVSPKCICRAGYEPKPDSPNECQLKSICSKCKNGVCPGGTEECQISTPCEQGYDRCPLKDCIPENWWCDGEPDCRDSADENLCHQKTCSPYKQFTCEGSGYCIDKSEVCNGITDCIDGSDEKNCPNFCDEYTEFQCKNSSKCLSLMYRCDQEVDCEDGSDEEGCEHQCNNATEFQCHNRQCIQLDWRCDMEHDCKDGSDELDCGEFRECHADEFQCENKQCIMSSWLCDKEFDCQDKTDEKNCSYALFCHHPNITCGQKNETCITPQKLCDGSQDCGDGADEQKCGKKEEVCAKNKCSDKCHPAPASLGIPRPFDHKRLPYICLCNEGRELSKDNMTCQATNICDTWGICEQICTKTLQGHVCSCRPGFHLEPDGFSCRPKDNKPIYAIFSNRHEMRSVDLTNHNYASLISGLHNTIALDFLDKYNYLFWTDVVDDKISRGVIQGNGLTNIEPIIDIGLATTEGLAIDWIGEKIYWVESKLFQIEVAGINGENRTTLVAGNMASPRAIVLDPRVGSLFWTDWDTSNPRIETCSMAGEKRHTIFKISGIVGGGWPNGLTIDYDFYRLYWIDARSDSIHTITYDGGDHRLILKDNENIRHPFALTLFGSNIYWTDWGINALIKANKFNGSNVTIIQQTITQPFDIQVCHPTRQPKANNPCALNNGNCSHLCLISYNNSVGCLCPHLMELSKDQKTCIPDQSFLLFVKSSEIRGVDLENANFSVIPTLTVPYVNKPVAVDYVSQGVEDYLYWADRGLKVINRARVNGSDVKTVVDSGKALNLEGFAVDWLSKNMYFSSYNERSNQGTITVARLDGAFRKEIFSKNATKANSLAIDPSIGLLYFSDYDDGKIWKIKLDGSDRQEIVTQANKPLSLKYNDRDKRLYWVNQGNNTILTCTTSGTDCRSVPVHSSIKPTALAVNDRRLYVAHNGMVVSMNTDGSKHVVLRDKTENVLAMHVFDKKRRSTGTNRCKVSNGDCSQLCLPTGPSTRTCACTAGFQLLNETFCTGIDSFILYSKESEIRGVLFNPKNNSDALPFISQIQKATVLDFHAETDYIYWVETATNYHISCIKRDLTSHEVIIKEDIGRIMDIAVDWIAGHLYWTDAQRQIIELVQLRKPHRRYVVVHNNLTNPKNIVVHPKRGIMIWMDTGSRLIEQAGLDGSNRQTILKLTGDVSGINGLTIDHSHDMIYWCDRQSKTIKSLDLNTNQDKVIMKDVALDCYSLTYFNGRIYWINVKGENGSIRSIPASGQNKQIKIMRSDLPKNVNDIKVFDAQLQKGTNLCGKNNGGCKEICLYNGVDVTCACFYGKLDKDGKSCTDHGSFLLFSKVTSIDSIHMNGNKNPPIKMIEDVSKIRNVIGLAMDYKEQRVFFSDIQLANIQAVKLNGSQLTDFTVVVGFGSVEGLAYDELQKYLYWTSYSDSSISRVKINSTSGEKEGDPEKLIQLSTNDHPRDIVIDGCTSRMFWTNWHNGKPGIQRAFLSGYNAQHIIDKDVRTPNGLTIDHKAQMLYWTDARLDKIERCDFNGLHRAVVMISIPQHPFGLAVYGNYLYWTDWMLRAVVRVNKYDGTDFMYLRRNLKRQPMGIVVVAEDANDCTLNPCRMAGCAHNCSVSVTGHAVCSCSPGYQLLQDGVRCARNDTVATCSSKDDFLCHQSSSCIPIQRVCDNIHDCIDGSDESTQVCQKKECDLGLFTCKNFQCVPQDKHCNGQYDCKDGSDETDCFCDKDSEFQCSNGKCIAKEYRCDMDKDCPDFSDEVGCNINCSEVNHETPGDVLWISCNTTSQCIMPSFLCDGTPDCWDSNDEKNCNSTGPEDCQDLFRCGTTGTCIPSPWRCDSDIDCTDGSDEKDCKYSCESNMINCTDGTCLPQSWQCDGHPDCPNGSDESPDVCKANRTCKDDQFLCSNSRCIPKDWLCDGDADCPNSEDEDVSLGCQPATCQDDEFKCLNGKCIKEIFYCDGDKDCMDGSDEPKSCARGCKVNEFRCTLHKNCIDAKLVCNGFPDCYDHSDESDCSTSSPDYCKGNDTFECKNHVCINVSLVCDGRNDCGDNSDEHFSCNINECTLGQNTCNQICVDKKIGYECQCHKGYQLDQNGHCSDINECTTQYPCSHFCVNTHGNYKCHCAQDYDLSWDKKTCKARGKLQPSLILANGFYLRNITFGGEQHLLLRDLNNAVAIDFDYKEKMIYWSEITSISSKISRLNLTSNGVEVIHNSTLRNPDGIAVDWFGRNIYWCDKTKDTIEVSKLDGRYRKVVIGEGLQEPRALEVFPAKGLLFYTDWGSEAHISSAYMDGTNVKKIVSKDLSWPNALTIDYVTEKIFWADANLDYIGMADLDGGNRLVIVDNNVPHVFDMTTFMDYLFWTDWEKMKIEKAHKFSGADRKPVASMIHRPMGIHVYHPMRQTDRGVNYCADNGGCSHLCLLKPDGHTCACPEFHYLAKDGRSCISNCTNSQHYCPKSSKCIPFWWKCDGVKDCEDGSDEPSDCDPYPCIRTGLFKCAHPGKNDTDCVNPFEICDGQPQCKNQRDELEEICSNYTCLSGFVKCVNNSNICILEEDLCDNPSCNPEKYDVKCKNKKCDSNAFTCKSGQCISYVWWCDSDVDCNDGSDEPENCTVIPCKDSYFKCNKTGRCIPESWKCDGDPDCIPDGSDESLSECAMKTCDNETQWQCEDKQCISKSWRCDHDYDCNDHSDEKNCAAGEFRKCSESEYRCNNNRCIHQSYRCDGEINCEDSSDEQNCNKTNNCTDSEFACSHVCISKMWRCDGEVDCPMSEDEINCTEPSVCKGKFQCGNGVCIPTSWQCDGDLDCTDGADENPVHCRNYTCSIDRFKCKNHRCIFASNRCDGIDNCGDASDEKHCKHERKCDINKYMCKGSSECIPMVKICDKNVDCLNGEDENRTLCNSHIKCGINRCQHMCLAYPSLQNYKCACKPGFRLSDDGYSCEEEDLCNVWGTCSQKCEVVRKNTNYRKAKCECEEDYVAGQIGNKASCLAKGDKPDILLAHEASLIRSSIHKNGQENSLKLKDSSWKITSMDADLTAENGDFRLFVIHHSANNRSIMSYSLNQAAAQGTRKKRDAPKQPMYGLAEPHGLAYDWIGRNIYWTDSQTRKIEMATHTFTKRRTVVQTGLDQPFSIAVHPEKGKIYWTDRGFPPKIESANLDGTGRKVFVKENMIWPNGLAIDYPNNRIYWVDTKKHTIETVDMQGKNRNVVRQFNKATGDPPYMLDVFEDFLYVSLYKSHSILRIHKFNNTKAFQDVYLFKNMKYIGNVLILHKSKQKTTIPNNCSSEEVCKRAWCINLPQLKEKHRCVCNDESYWANNECNFYQCQCKNGGQCIKDTKICSCPPQFRGPQCEIDCGNFCLNQGNCSSNADNQTICQCPKSYTGKRCEIYKCTNYCLHYGECYVDTTGRPKCRCPYNYSGEKCELSMCDGYCKNNGSCTIDRYQQKKCHCSPGWSGETCQEKSSDCKNFCLNGGTCTVEGNKISNSPLACKCRPGYSGTKCETSVCDNYSCSQHGNCLIDNDGKAKCNCTKFYMGDNCDTCSCKNSGLCKANATQNGAKNTYCSCSGGFSGELCETKPCEGQCVNGHCEPKNCKKSKSGQYVCSICSCTQGYGGSNCASKLASQQSSPTTTILLAVIIPVVLLIIIIIVIIIIIIARRRKRNPFSHQRMNGSMEVPNPVFLRREQDSTDDESREMAPLDNNFDLEDHDTNFANPMFDRLYQAESTDVLLPKESDQDNNIIKGNGSLRIFGKKDKKDKKDKSGKK